MEFKISNLSFLIFPLLDPNNEQFTVEVLYYASISPVPTAIKDYMVKTTFSAEPGTNALKDKRDSNILYYQVKDSQVGASLTVKIKIGMITKPTAETISRLDEREGSRLLVGRYCVLDKRL